MDRALDGDFPPSAEDGLAELEPDDHLDVRAGHGTGTPTSPAGASGCAVEEGIEEVAQSAATEDVPWIAAEPAVAGGRTEDAFDPEPVIAGPALGIAEHLVGHAHLFEPRIGGGVAAGGVRVQLARLLPVGALELVVTGVAASRQAGRSRSSFMCALLRSKGSGLAEASGRVARRPPGAAASARG